MSRLGLAVLSLVATLVLAAPASSRIAGRIVAQVGPGPILIVETREGAPVRTLKPGRYLFFVRDLSNRRNFHLQGPGVNRASSLKGVRGGAIWRVTLRRGTYRYFSDRFRATMHGSFKVA